MSKSGQKGTSASRIYDQLRHAIIFGHISPGERLSLDGLAQQYGTSVTPVREALQMLNQEELVTVKPRSGFYVTEVTLKELRDLLQLREILEVTAVELATPRITEEQLDELEQIHSGYTGDDIESYERYIMENSRLHYLIAQASGNQELANMLGKIHERLTRFFVFVHTGQEMELRHKRLLKAIRSRDVEHAKQVILEEVRETRDITLEHIIQEEGGRWQVRVRK